MATMATMANGVNLNLNLTARSKMIYGKIYGNRGVIYGNGGAQVGIDGGCWAVKSMAGDGLP